MVSRKLVPSFEILALLVVFSASSQGLHVCEEKITDCEGDACFKSIPCYHGNCNEAGKCECDFCWEGESCEDYIDNFLPEFLDSEETIVYSESMGLNIIYSALAYDNDLGKTCPPNNKQCDCAEIRYFIEGNGIEKLFYINEETGDINVKHPSRMIPGSMYNLTIVAGSKEGIVSPSTYARKRVRVVIENSHQYVEEMRIYDTDDRILSRIKRAADGVGEATYFNFTIGSGEPENMTVGEVVDYILGITVPKTDSMTLNVEIFTKDVGNDDYSPTLTIFNVKIEEKDSDLSFSVGDEPEIEMITSDEISTAYDRAIVNFGEVENKNDDPLTIYLLFSVTQIRNPKTKYDAEDGGGIYMVTAGAEFDKENYIWVGESRVTAHNSTEKYSIEVDISGPMQIDLDSAAVFKLTIYAGVKSDTFTSTVTGPDEEDLASVGNFGLDEFGKNFDPMPKDKYYYNTTRDGTEEKDFYKSATLDLGTIANIGDFKKAKEDGNAIITTFAIYALNYPDNVNKDVKITVTVTVGDEEIEKKTKTVKISDRKSSSQSDIKIDSSGGELNSTELDVGDMVMYSLWFNLSADGFSDFVVELETEEHKGIPRLEACSARLYPYEGNFDIPHVNTTFIEPEVTDNKKFLFEFNRIHVTNQRDPPMYNDTMIYVQLILKISAVSVNKDGEELKINIKAGTSGSADTSLDEDKIVIKETMTDYVTPSIELKIGSKWEELYLGGAMVLNITMEVPEGRGYPELFVESSGQSDPSYPAVHLCQMTLIDVERNLPCLRLHQDEINEKFVKYSETDPSTRYLPDVSSLVLGDVGSLPSVFGENKATISVVVGLPENASISDGDKYPISSAIITSRNVIWSSKADVTIKDGTPPDLKKEEEPTAQLYIDSNTKFSPSDFSEVEVWVDMKIQTTTKLTIELEAGSKDLSVCKFRVKSFGKNLPCVDKTTEPYYKLQEDELDGNKIGGMTFMALSNIGFRADEEADRLKVIALVRIAPACKMPSVELKWRVIFNGGQVDGSKYLSIGARTESFGDSPKYAEAKALAFGVVHKGKAVGLGSPVVVDFEVSLENGELPPVVLEVQNKEAGDKYPYDMCIGGVWFRGKNYACFHPAQLENTYSTSSKYDMSEHKDTAKLDLGLVCNTFVDEEIEEDKVIVHVALRTLDDISVGDKFGVKGVATVGDHKKELDTLEFTVAEETEEVQTDEKPSIKLHQDSPYSIKIRERIWIPFNITIPLDSVLKVDFKISMPVEDDRAILTVYDLKLTSGGINIPCPTLYPKPEVELTATTPTTQKDVAKATFGYFTNLGITHKMHQQSNGDDDITIEAQVEMSDHPATKHNEKFDLSVTAVVGKETLEIKQQVQVNRNGMETPLLDIDVTLRDSKTYERKEEIEVTATIKHNDNSRVEPLYVYIRFFLPPYVEYEKNVSTDVTVVGKVEYVPEYGGFDVKIPQFLFSDSATVTVIFVADPYTQRDYGEGVIPATTPYRVLCLMTTRDMPFQNPVKNPGKLFSCGPIGFLPIKINSAECYNPLGVDDMDLCQLSASSAVNKEMGPDKVGKGKGGWSPALRSGYPKPLLNIDFQRFTRVTKLEFYKVEGKRSVTKYRIQSTFTGFLWIDSNDVTELEYNDDGMAADVLKVPFPTRYIRLIVEEVEKEDEDSKYVGVELEVYGCYLTEKHSTIKCPKTDTTWYSDDQNKYMRHYSVDTGNNLIHFCDLEFDMKNLICFCSSDEGSSWKILPRTIGGIIGYDGDSGLTFAYDKHRRAYMSNEDCETWVLADGKDVNDTIEKDSFSPSVYVPAYTSEDIKDMEKGEWKASFEGLVHSSSPDPKAKWSRCCKAK